MTGPIHIVGGGLAGSEAAWQLAERGHDVVLHEMRGVRGTPAHKTDRLAELVCSNTFKSTETTNAHGLLKAEMRLLGSVVLWAADEARVPGGTALAVDRDVFSSTVHERVTSHPENHHRARRGRRPAEPGHRRHGAAHLRRARRVDSCATRRRIARVLRLDRADRRPRVDRRVDRLSGVALRQGDDGRRRGRRVHQLSVHARTV